MNIKNQVYRIWSIQRSALRVIGIVSNAKSRSSLQLSFTVAFVVFISTKHSEESHSEGETITWGMQALIYLSQPLYLVVIFCAFLLRITANTKKKKKNFLKFKPLIL